MTSCRPALQYVTGDPSTMEDKYANKRSRRKKMSLSVHQRRTVMNECLILECNNFI